MSVFKKSYGIPLYLQIKEDLRYRIAAMNYGDQIETEEQLAERYKVSRGTVRKAITELVNEGLLTKIHGKGTFKSGVALDRSSTMINSFTDQLLASGLVPGIQDVNVTTIPVEGKIAQYLRLQAGTPVWKLSRVRLADRKPISYCAAFIKKDYVPSLQAEDLKMSLIAMLTEVKEVPLDHGKSVVTATLAGKKVAALLGIKPTTAILRLEHVGYTASGDAVFLDVTDSIGERYVMHIAQGSYESDNDIFEQWVD